MSLSVTQLLDDLLMREGRTFTHHKPTDPPTKFGITPVALASARGVPVSQITPEDIEALTEARARDIYRRLYLEQPKIDQIKNGSVRAFIFDWAVHAGPKRAIRQLQFLLGVSGDGVLGPLTLAAIEQRDPHELLTAMKLRRWDMLWDQARAQIPDATWKQLDKTDVRYLHGWARRLLSFA